MLPSFWSVPSIPVFYHIKKQLGEGQSLFMPVLHASCVWYHRLLHVCHSENLLNVYSSVYQHLSGFGNDYSNMHSLPGLLVPYNP